MQTCLPCAQKYTSPLAGFDNTAINYSNDASELFGHTFAPAGTTAYANESRDDVIKVPGQYVALPLAGAVRTDVGGSGIG